MKNNKLNQPLNENTKDDSSDIKKVRENKTTAQHKSFNSNDKNHSKEDEEAQKGHS